MSELLGGSPPRPEPDPDLPTVNPAHTNYWWNDRGERQQTSCTCDTGRSHTTPREGR